MIFLLADTFQKSSGYLTLCCNLEGYLKFESGVLKISPPDQRGRVCLNPIADEGGIPLHKMKGSRATHGIFEKPVINVIRCPERENL